LTKQDDALASLSSGGISERAEAVRVLGRVGDASVLDTLLNATLGDKSPGVRLAAASAAADVLARLRMPPHRAALSEPDRLALLTHLRGIDPGRNTGLFQILACLGDPMVIRNLGRGVRDPRVDVRTGALVGLERLACSGTVNGLPALERTLRGLLQERRLRSDASLGVADLAWRMGQWTLRPEVEALGSQLEERWQGALTELLEVLPDRLGSEHLLGCWAGRGLDCGEQRVQRGPLRYLVVLPSNVLMGAGSPMTEAPWQLDDGLFVCAPCGDPAPVRVLRCWYDGQEHHEVLQVGTQSYGRLVEKDLPALVDALASQPFDTAAHARQLLALLGPQLSERSPGAYTRAVLSVLADDPKARERLDTLLAGKRPRVELHWHLATLHLARGRRRSARTAAKAYLRLADEKGPFHAAAQALVGGKK
jgi:hypothetical protein